MAQSFGNHLTRLGVLTSRPAAFVLFLAYAAAWPLLQPETFDWHAVATLATWGMTLVIQRSEHRDTQAIQAKLDELIKAQSGARNEMAAIDQMEPEEIEKSRSDAAVGASGSAAGNRSA